MEPMDVTTCKQNVAVDENKIFYCGDQMNRRVVTSLNGNIFRVTGPLWGESTGHESIPLMKASNAELWCLLWSALEQTVEQTIEAPVIWDAIAFIMTPLHWNAMAADACQTASGHDIASMW